MPEPAVILLSAPIRTVEVVSAPSRPAAPADARPVEAPPVKAPPPEALLAEAKAALEASKARLDEEGRRLAETRAALTKAIEGLRAAESDVLAGAEAQVIELSLAIAGKVIMQEIEAGRFQMEPVVREALRHVPSRRDVIVHLSPPDAAAWQQGGTVAPANGMKVVADSTLSRGDCLVETAEAAVLATVTERLEAVAQTLRQAGQA
jgi:flagellar biosynthesis/type III secretory pathway protein FliH